MPFFRDFFHNLFGSGANDPKNQRSDEFPPYRDRFRNPIWQNDEEDDDEYDNDGRHFGPRQGFHFKIFTNPFEMTQYFESQMDSMMKDFFNFGFNQGPGMIPFDDQNLPQLMPPPERQHKSLREEFLKPGYDYSSSNPEEKVDIDLDGKISAQDFSKIWKDPNSSENMQLDVPQNKFNFHSFGQSIVSQTVRRPDGSIEEKKTVTDSQGNAETTVRRKIGDKIYTVITKRDKDGVERKTEEFQNIDEHEVQNFENNWKPVEPAPIQPGILSDFPWQKFVGFNPKL
ncbi:HCLS1-associated protein X-1 [Chelonus insularis]|uniref:HCLS1-associated protein X-1 n=1 Tax=Chelonus insularis TaxID=460826 RepID=UPI0015892FF6|nr:HCLS1-associated protein X-1 [Chelonus insularis]